MKDALGFSTSEYMILNPKEISEEKTLMKKQSGSGKLISVFYLYVCRMRNLLLLLLLLFACLRHLPAIQEH